MLKTSEFSPVVFNTQDDIFGIYRNESKVSFYFIQHMYFIPLKRQAVKMTSFCWSCFHSHREFARARIPFNEQMRLVINIPLQLRITLQLFLFFRHWRNMFIHFVKYEGKFLLCI